MRRASIVNYIAHGGCTYGALATEHRMFYECIYILLIFKHQSIGKRIQRKRERAVFSRYTCTIEYTKRVGVGHTDRTSVRSTRIDTHTQGRFFSSIWLLLNACHCCCYCSMSSQPFLGRSSTIHEMEMFDKKACVSVYTRWQRRCKFRIFRTNSSNFIHSFSVWSWRHLIKDI